MRLSQSHLRLLIKHTRHQQRMSQLVAMEAVQARVAAAQVPVHDQSAVLGQRSIDSVVPGVALHLNNFLPLVVAQQEVSGLDVASENEVGALFIFSEY